jgi:hypothetical protein
MTMMMVMPGDGGYSHRESIIAKGATQSIKLR